MKAKKNILFEKKRRKRNNVKRIRLQKKEQTKKRKIKFTKKILEKMFLITKFKEDKSKKNDGHK